MEKVVKGLESIDLRRATNILFRSNRELALKILKIIELTWAQLKKSGYEHLRIMNFCGTHEWTTTRYGLRSLLPEGIELLAGPGCPVCITPSHYVEAAIKLSLEGVRVYTYGDAYKLPSVKKINGVKSLDEAKASGGDVVVVYSLLDAIRDVVKNRVESTFLAIGFETTYPAYALAILKEETPENLSYIVAGRLTPPAAEYAVERVGGVDGVIAPGHVSTITGGEVWINLAEKYSIPTVVSGFEPIDVLLSIAEILKQKSRGEARVVIEYARAVTWSGNVNAKKAINEVFGVHDAAWRGIGIIPKSGYKLREEYRRFDAFDRYGFREPTRDEWCYDLLPGCRCGEVIIGKIKPSECSLFMKKCTPDSPYGPCMVSSEGTCRIHALHTNVNNIDEIRKIKWIENSNHQ
ncbi:MAG: hydrogenase formation protein HypD [Nitrososphaerota archaeon]